MHSWKVNHSEWINRFWESPRSHRRWGVGGGGVLFRFSQSDRRNFLSFLLTLGGSPSPTCGVAEATSFSSLLLPSSLSSAFSHVLSCSYLCPPDSATQGKNRRAWFVFVVCSNLLSPACRAEALPPIWTLRNGSFCSFVNGFQDFPGTGLRSIKTEFAIATPNS